MVAAQYLDSNYSRDDGNSGDVKHIQVDVSSIDNKPYLREHMVALTESGHTYRFKIRAINEIVFRKCSRRRYFSFHPDSNGGA